MTLAAQIPTNSYIGTGGANSYNFTFPVFQAGDIVVTVTSPVGVISILKLATDYIVAGLNPTGAPPNTGSITLVNSGQLWLTSGNLTTSWTIQISRVVALSQNTSVRNQGDFFPETLESAYDYLMMAIQQLSQALTNPALPASLTTVTGDITNITAGAGMIATTPNGLHTYRIAIDNLGQITSQQIT